MFIDTALPPIVVPWAVNLTCILQAASALEGSGLLAPPPGRFTPGKDPVPTVQKVGWASVLVWTGTASLFFSGVQSLARPARIESLYTLCCVGR